MNDATDGTKNTPFAQRRIPVIILALLNLVMLTFAALLYGRYIDVYQERLRDENLGNIASLNQSSALNATALIESWNIKLSDIAGYAVKHGMTCEELLVLIEQSNSSEERQFELIGSDYTGYLARRGEDGRFISLSYEKGVYSDLQRSIDDVNDDAYGDICFAPEFTDGATALKYFAIYRHLPLKDERGNTETYALLLATKSNDVLAVLNAQIGFEGQSTVLMDDMGNYIVGNSDFKSDNFFQYLYVYNDLTLDQRNEIEREVKLKGSGELYCKNAMAQDCVFRFERMMTNGWYCVTCVPISSFRTPVFNTSYAIHAVIALLLMLGIDVAYLQYINRRLRASAMLEKEASEAKTEFLSRMSHDIRTPLNGIIGLTTLALDEDTSPRIREYLENIRVSGQFLTGLVNDILDLSKVESGKVELNPEPYYCRELYKYVGAVVTPLCREKGLDFRLQPPDDDPPVLLDRLRFNQIVFNLLSNSVKYTPTGGFVELSWTREDLPGGRVSLDIQVRDNGVGMSEQFQEHMFESFTQERSQTAKTGSGLGLAIVYSLVKLMNGSISVESKKDVGTVFTVHIETDICKDEAVAEPEIESAKLEGKRALLCEDNQINIMVAQRMLEKWGMSVDTAVNGKEGLDKFNASAAGRYDIILMDVMMPVMDGLDAARAIRASKRADAKSVPILAMTANAYDTDVKNCLDAGMNSHLGKPIDQDQLHRLLSELIGENEQA